MEVFAYIVVIIAILIFLFLSLIATKSIFWGLALTLSLVVPILATMLPLLNFYLKHKMWKGYFINIIKKLSEQYNISDVEKDLYKLVFYTDIYTNADYDFVYDNFFNILFSSQGIDVISESEIVKIFGDGFKGDIFKEFRKYNLYKAESNKFELKNVFFTIILQVLYGFDQEDKSKKTAFLLGIALLMISSIKIFLIIKTGGWIMLTFDLVSSIFYYLLYYFLCKHYEWVSYLNIFWLLDIIFLALFCVMHTALFSNFRIIFLLIFKLLFLNFIGMKMLDYYGDLKLQKNEKIDIETFSNKVSLLIKTPFLWEMILLNILANILMFAAFMYPQMSYINAYSIISDLNCTYKELCAIICTCNSISNFFSMSPLIQYSGFKVVLINLLQDIVTFVINTFFIVKIVNCLFLKNQTFANEESMLLITCPECGEKISNKATICLHCGFLLKEVKVTKSGQSSSKKQRVKRRCKKRNKKICNLDSRN